MSASSDATPPEIVMSPQSALARSAAATEAHVATPAPLSERTNWFVHVEPAYADAAPEAPVTMSEDWMPETVRLVVDAEDE